jgi:uncharacterized protein CbrC (UPF0167 family)
MYSFGYFPSVRLMPGKYPKEYTQLCIPSQRTAVYQNAMRSHDKIKELICLLCVHGVWAVTQFQASNSDSALVVFHSPFRHKGFVHFEERHPRCVEQITVW